MSSAASKPILQLIRRLYEDPRVANCSDADLLKRFLDHQDEAAFETLVRRHGPMVLDVCRGMSHNEADVEDAFQATFLILAHKAKSVRKAESLASWLHGVAYRTACKARTEYARRRKHEARVRVPSAVHDADDLTWREVRQALHEELSHLPLRLREPLVLCYLQAKTQDQAAEELGLPKGTLKGRLERGRQLLRVRLLQKGLGPTAVLAASVWPTAHVCASVPPVLVGSTVRAALLVAGGQAVAGSVSTKVAALTGGVMKAMFVTKIKIATTVLLLALVGFGTALMMNEITAAEPQVQANPARRPAAGPVEGRANNAAPRVDGPAGQKHKPVVQPVVGKQDLAGEWLMHLPAGFEHRVALTPAGPNRYRLAPGWLNSSGVYEVRGDKLVIVEPNDRLLLGFAWEANGSGFVLVGQPPAGKTGSNYLGATLTRADQAGVIVESDVVSAAAMLQGEYEGAFQNRGAPGVSK